jgi:single-stranded DNA-binding protein
MMTITATGLVPEKPELLLVGKRHARKCEFVVVDSRWIPVNGQWRVVWERVVFVAWDDQAEKLASKLEPGSHVCCTGLLETERWEDKHGQKRYSPRYRLTAWAITRNTWRPGVLDYDKSIAAAGSCSPTGVATSPGKKDKAKASGHGGTSTMADAGRVTYNAVQESVGVGK